MLKRAFLNQYNMILLGGSGLLAAASQNWLPLIVGAGLETLWLVLGSDSQFFHRWVNVQDGIAAKELREKLMLQAQHELTPSQSARLDALRQTQREIIALAAATDQLHRDVLKPELEKMATLLESFVRLGAMLVRLKAVREGAKERELQRDIIETQKEIRELEKQNRPNPTLRASLQTHLDLCNKRLHSIDELRAQAASIDVQLDTIEQTFAYLKTNVANMTAPEAFAGEIDNVLNGIDAAEKTFAETARFQQAISRTS